ncbi:hypothetical protein BGX29_009693 [Mortierella sp. GBA35]|nr:hypothetical protein BGX29_009693 [Mortierella sp. GBA35]
MSSAKETIHEALQTVSEKAHPAQDTIKQIKESEASQRYVLRPADHLKQCLKCTSFMTTCAVKSEVSVSRVLGSLVLVLLSLAYISVSDLNYCVTQDWVVKMQFRMHAPTLHMSCAVVNPSGSIRLLG